MPAPPAFPCTRGRLAALLPLAGERPLVLINQLLPTVVSEDGEGWRSALEQLDVNWFAPLKKALGKQVNRVGLIAPTVYGELRRYTLTAGDRWKLWKSGGHRRNGQGTRPMTRIVARPTFRRASSGNLSSKACTRYSPASTPRAA